MTPYKLYQQRTASPPRIDMLLALFDGAIERLETARAALQHADRRPAARSLLRAQRIVAELMGGLDLRFGEVPLALQRLYVFVMHATGVATPEKVADAVRVLSIVRDGLRQIRSEAIELERLGEIPPIDSMRFVEVTG